MFVGNDYSTLVPSDLPHQTRMNLVQSDNVCDESLEELVASLPELVVIHDYHAVVEVLKNKPTKSSNSKDADAEWSNADEYVH